MSENDATMLSIPLLWGERGIRREGVGEVGEGKLISFEMIILPVSMLQRTSHQLGRSANAGLHTPAIKPGL